MKKIKYYKQNVNTMVFNRPFVAKVSHVTCHMSCVTCPLIFFVSSSFGQSGEASQLRVCFQRGLPRLVWTRRWHNASKLSKKKVVIKIKFAQRPDILRYCSGCVLKRREQQLSKSCFSFSIPVFDFVYIGIKITLKCNLPGVTQHGIRLPKSNFSCGDKKKSENFGWKSMQRHKEAAKK